MHGNASDTKDFLYLSFSFIATVILFLQLPFSPVQISYEFFAGGLFSSQRTTSVSKLSASLLGTKQQNKQSICESFHEYNERV